MRNGFWILPAALIAAFLFISTGCHFELNPTPDAQVAELER